MQLSMKCSIAVHCLIFIWETRGKVRVTSPLLSESTRYSQCSEKGRTDYGGTGKRRSQSVPETGGDQSV